MTRQEAPTGFGAARLSPHMWELVSHISDVAANTGHRNDRWVPSGKFDKRTVGALVRRRLVMEYPYSDSRELVCLTQEGQRLVYSVRRANRRRARSGL